MLPGLGPLELRALGVGCRGLGMVVEVLGAEEEHDPVRDELRPDRAAEVCRGAVLPELHDLKKHGERVSVTRISKLEI